MNEPSTSPVCEGREPAEKRNPNLCFRILAFSINIQIIYVFGAEPRGNVYFRIRLSFTHKKPLTSRHRGRRGGSNANFIALLWQVTVWCNEKFLWWNLMKIEKSSWHNYRLLLVVPVTSPSKSFQPFFLKGAAYDRTYDTFQVIICHHLLVTKFKMQAHRGHDTRDFPREA